MEQFSVAINLLRQWHFCPRVVYYRSLLALPAAEPLWSRQGSEYHQRENILFKRRNLSRFQLEKGRRYYGISLRDDNLQLHGIADLIIETDNALYCVEYKLSSTIRASHKVQLAAYAMLAESNFHKPALSGFIIGNEKSKVFTINIDSDLRKSVLSTRNAIQKMLQNANKPHSSATIHQCGQCEYLNYCNDR